MGVEQPVVARIRLRVTIRRSGRSPKASTPSGFAPGRSDERPHYVYFPFGGGPRQCIGKGFAPLEAALALALLTQRYELHLVLGRRVEMVAMATLRPRYGMWVTAHPRSTPSLWGGQRDDAAGARLAVVAPRDITERCAGRLASPYSPDCLEVRFSQIC